MANKFKDKLAAGCKAVAVKIFSYRSDKIDKMELLAIKLQLCTLCFCLLCLCILYSIERTEVFIKFHITHHMHFNFGWF